MKIEPNIDTKGCHESYHGYCFLTIKDIGQHKKEPSFVPKHIIRNDILNFFYIALNRGRTKW
jgi:hypothetical protein